MDNKSEVVNPLSLEYIFMPLPCEHNALIFLFLVASYILVFIFPQILSARSMPSIRDFLPFQFLAVFIFPQMLSARSMPLFEQQLNEN